MSPDDSLRADDDPEPMIPSSTRIRRRLLAVGVTLLAVTAVAPAQSAAARTIDGVQWLTDITYGQDRGPLTLDVYMPPTAGTDRPAVIFLHGGGWHGGDKRICHKDGCTQLAQMGWVAFSVNYNLNPPRWPNELRDVEQAISFVRQNAANYGVNPDEIGLIGSSAGANLALLAGYSGSGPENTGSRVGVVVSWSAATDVTALVGGSLCAGADPTVCSLRQKEPGLVEGFTGCTLSSCPQTYKDASPVNLVDPTDPPTLVANSTDELIPLPQATELTDTLQRNDVPVKLVQIPGSNHADAYQSQIWPDTVAWLKQWIGVSRNITASPPPSGNASAPSPASPPPASGPPSSGGGSFPIIPVAIGAVVVVLLAIVLARRRLR